MQNKNRKGFTLIELLIVVVIIGILAAIAIPKFANTKEKAYLASMKGDLRNLSTAQEGFAADNAGAYMAGTASNLPAGPVALNGYVPSSGVTVTATYNAGPPAGWSAVASHNVTTKTCAIFVNTAPVAPATVDGEPKCTP